MIQSNKDGQQTVKLDHLWRKFLELPEKEAFEKGKAIFNNKNELVTAVNALENDNCVMFSPEDGNIVLI